MTVVSEPPEAMLTDVSEQPRMSHADHSQLGSRQLVYAHLRQWVIAYNYIHVRLALLSDMYLDVHVQMACAV